MSRTATVITAEMTIDSLRPVGLDELVRRAALLTRVDRKYLLPAGQLPSLLRRLDGDVRVLQIDQRRRFGYRSDYFDTPELDSYLAAARRRRRRFKVRVRSYLDSGQQFIEVKTRGERGATVKQRTPYHWEGSWLGPVAQEHTASVLDRAGIACDTWRLRPVLATRYQRTTLLLPATGSRVTIDTDLAWALPDGRAITTPDRVIVETKTGQGACGVDRLLWSLGHRPCPVSKYGTGLAALCPDLPANRWQPVLRRHFPATTEEPQP